VFVVIPLLRLKIESRVLCGVGGSLQQIDIKRMGSTLWKYPTRAYAEDCRLLQ
jgi:hypothetical protein